MDVMVLMGEQGMDPFGDLRQAAVPFEPVVDPAGWTAAEMAAREDWLYSFNDDEIAELRAAIAQRRVAQRSIQIASLATAVLPCLTGSRIA